MSIDNTWIKFTKIPESKDWSCQCSAEHNISHSLIKKVIRKIEKYEQKNEPMIIVSKYSLEVIKIRFNNKDDFRIELTLSSEGKKATDIKNKKSLKDEEILKYIPKLFSKINRVNQQPSLQVAEKAK